VVVFRAGRVEQCLDLGDLGKVYFYGRLSAGRVPEPADVHKRQNRESEPNPDFEFREYHTRQSVAVPQPGTIGFALMGVGVLLGRRRFRGALALQ
jgi:hypothetical protein